MFCTCDDGGHCEICSPKPNALSASQLKALGNYLEDEQDQKEANEYLYTPAGEKWLAGLIGQLRKAGSKAPVDTDLTV